MSTTSGVTFNTRLAGKEDLYLGSGTSTFVDGGGTSRTLTALNAGVIPVLSDVSSATGADNINGAILALHNEMGGVSMLGDDTECEFGETTASERQALVDFYPKNLGGHTLTFTFTESIDVATNALLNIGGFYNGKVVVDFNGIVYEDASVLDSLVSVVNCHCSVIIKNGTVKHTKGTTGIYVNGSYDVLQSGLTFSGLSGRTDYYATKYNNGDGYQSGCSFVNDSRYAFTDDKYNALLSNTGSGSGITSQTVSSMISAHNADLAAHNSQIEDVVSVHNSNAAAHSSAITSRIESSISAHLGDLSAHSSAIMQQINTVVGGGIMVTLDEAREFRGTSTITNLVQSTYISSGSSQLTSGQSQTYDSKSYHRVYRTVSGGTIVRYMKCGGTVLCHPTYGSTISFPHAFTDNGPVIFHAIAFGTCYNYMDTARNITTSDFHENTPRDTNYCCVVGAVNNNNILFKVRDTDEIQGRCCMVSWSAEGCIDPEGLERDDYSCPVSSGSSH